MVRPLTQGRAINVSPAISADGTKLAFTSDRSGGPQIYVMSLNGGASRRITFQGDYNANPAFSPVDDRIAYQSRSQGIFDIYTILFQGGDPVRLTGGGMSSQHPTGRPMAVI